MWPFIYKEIFTTKRIIAQKLGFKNLKFAERSNEPWKIIEDIEFRTVTLVGNI